MSDGAILAGDVGGTKVALGLFETEGGSLRQVRDAQFPSQRYESLEAVLAEFLGSGDRPRLGAACFAVAGAVIGGRAEITNLPWVIEEAALARATGVPRVALLNDLQATAYGMLYLSAGEVAVLQPAEEPSRRGNIAVIAAGTGLGEAMLYWDGKRYHPVASEGGHADFAPRTDLEIELLRHLRATLKGRVSYERVLSGPGIVNLYSFLRDTGRAPEPDWLKERLESGDKAAVISEVGLEGRERLCAGTLDLFAAIYGAEAGNGALRCVALSGVFVCGGIAPKILPALERGGFMESFRDKGRFSDFMRRVEVRVALDPEAPLRGAAHYVLDEKKVES